MASPSPNASAAAPSYEVLHRFLWQLAEWFAEAQVRLTCRNDVVAHTLSADDLARHYHRAYGWVSTWVGGSWQRNSGAAVDAADAALPRVALQLTAAVLLRGGLLLLLWWALPRRVWADMLPRLRAWHITRRLRSYLTAHEHDARELADTLLRPDVAQRRVNANALWTAWVCGVVGCVLILGLLSMHVWVDVVLWQMVLRWAAPLRQAWSWAQSHTPRPADETAPYGVQPASHVPLWGITRTLAPLRRIAEHARLFYLWSVVGGTALAAALWLLRHATDLLGTYNASVPFFSDSDAALRQLARQDAEDTQRRTEATLQAVLLHQRAQAATLEGLARALEGRALPPLLSARLPDHPPPLAASESTEALTGVSATAPCDGVDDAACAGEDNGAAAADGVRTSLATSSPDAQPPAPVSAAVSSDGAEAWTEMEEENDDSEAARCSACADAADTGPQPKC